MFVHQYKNKDGVKKTEVNERMNLGKLAHTKRVKLCTNSNLLLFLLIRKNSFDVGIGRGTKVENKYP